MAEATALSTEQMRGTIDAFFAAVSRMDWSGAAAVFADNAVVEDPAGSPKHEGKAAIEAFYGGMGGLMESIDLHAVDVYFVENGAAARWTASAKGLTGQSAAVEGIDVYRFDDKARLTSLVGYWDAAGFIGALRA
jgi:steroid Delta-isomerase